MPNYNDALRMVGWRGEVEFVSKSRGSTISFGLVQNDFDYIQCPGAVQSWAFQLTEVETCEREWERTQVAGFSRLIDTLSHNSAPQTSATKA